MKLVCFTAEICIKCIITLACSITYCNGACGGFNNNNNNNDNNNNNNKYYFSVVFLYMSLKLINSHISWKEPTRCDRVVEFIIPVFLNCSTCSGRHTTHHQELKNCNCSLWFYIRFWLPAAAMAQPSQRPATINVCKTRGCNYSF